ncbi:MAG: carbohydrate kinase family protein [Clostridia bacterium]|nr:carbohydrate kinase family protein [Clostridia bacterium]
MSWVRRNGISVAGTALVDTICDIAAYPNCGELTQIRGVERSVGGCVPNVTMDLKTIRPDLPVRAISKVGCDSNGEFLVKTLKQAGINCSGIAKSPEERTSFTNVMSVIGGQRTFFTYAGACASFGHENVPFDDINSKILLLGYFLLLQKVDNGDGVQILREAQQRGIKTAIDLVSENSNRYSLILPCLQFTDYLIVNEIEAGHLADMTPSDRNLPKIAERLRKLGVKEKVIIHKSDRALCLSDKGLSIVGSYELPSDYIKGTTGAGDAFCAGALIGLHSDWPDERILEFASAAAAVSLSSADAVSGLKSEEEILKICREWKRVPVCL